jgi:hypothetical protein
MWGRSRSPRFGAWGARKIGRERDEECVSAPRAARNNLPRHSLVLSVAADLCPVTYSDLIELARLCLLRATVARTPAAANELRWMAKEYQDRADALLKEQRPGTADGALGRPAPEAPSRTAQQQQQPQVEQGRDDAQSGPWTPKRS